MENNVVQLKKQKTKFGELDDKKKKKKKKKMDESDLLCTTLLLAFRVTGIESNVFPTTVWLSGLVVAPEILGIHSIPAGGRLFYFYFIF